MTMNTVTVTAFCLLGTLGMYAKVEATSQALLEAAVNWQGALPCGNWDCKCIFSQRGCCCGANQLHRLEEAVFTRMFGIYSTLSQVTSDLDELTGGRRVAFTTSFGRQSCFGPFTSNVPIPYDNVSLNHGNGYNPALGAFTAPRAGLYSFSISVYSNVGQSGERLYHRVRLMKNGQVVASVWEDNREDSEDSATQTVLLQLQRGCQVYVELQSGRQLCNTIHQHNAFSGYMLYCNE